MPLDVSPGKVIDMAFESVANTVPFTQTIDWRIIGGSVGWKRGSAVG